jgi:hypothetical protein
VWSVGITVGSGTADRVSCQYHSTNALHSVFSCQYHSTNAHTHLHSYTVKRTLNGTWAYCQPVFNGTPLQSRRPKLSYRTAPNSTNSGPLPFRYAMFHCTLPIRPEGQLAILVSTVTLLHGTPGLFSCCVLHTNSAACMWTTRTAVVCCTQTVRPACGQHKLPEQNNE